MQARSDRAARAVSIFRFIALYLYLVRRENEGADTVANDYRIGLEKLAILGTWNDLKRQIVGRNRRAIRARLLTPIGLAEGAWRGGLPAESCEYYQREGVRQREK